MEQVVERFGGRGSPVAASGSSPTRAIAGLAALLADRADAAPLIAAALERDFPVLCIDEGMHALNTALGGGPPEAVRGHDRDEQDGPSYHRIFIAPGSRLAAAVGSGGFVRVNSLHGGRIVEARRSPSLMVSAYGLEDGVIEALESTSHRWAVGVQFRPERRSEIPPHFDGLFRRLVQNAAEIDDTTR